MAFLLGSYWARGRESVPEHGIQCPAGLIAELAANALRVEATKTNGDCGVHGFLIGLVDAGKRYGSLANSNAFKAVSKEFHKDTCHAISHLRKRSVTFMTQMQNEEMWEGMTLKTLAMHMSTIKDNDFSAYLRRMAVDGEWLDALALHALACSYKVDLLVWQEGIDQTILGHSHARSGTPPLAMITTAMVNDLHYWGVVPIADDTTTKCANLDKGEFMHSGPAAARKHKTASERHTDATDEAAADDRGDVIRVTDRSKNKPLEQAELQLCTALATWNPWDLPTSDVIASLQSVTSAASGDTLAAESRVIRWQTAVEELEFERQYADRIPERFKYNGAARWHITNRTTTHWDRRRRQALMNEYLENCSDFSVDAIACSISCTCARGKNPHWCLDPFRANPSSVRTWRIMWRSLPAPMRRETLIKLYQHKRVGHADGDKDWRRLIYTTVRFLL